MLSVEKVFIMKRLVKLSIRGRLKLCFFNIKRMSLRIWQLSGSEGEPSSTNLLNHHQDNTALGLCLENVWKFV